LVSTALERIGRRASEAEIAERVASLGAIGDLPGYEEDNARIDTSLEANREILTRWFRAVGFDPEWAEAVWALDLEPAGWPVYPDVAEVVEEIRSRGCRTALVSDFHVDLRPHLEASGIRLDAHVISFEHGFTKPDPRMFTTALDLLGIGPHEALMVGDRPSHDGGAAAVGIDTLILPPPKEYGPRGLDVILRLL
jgi:HAD superfamily hydrolase (TIGR01549 family)